MKRLSTIAILFGGFAATCSSTTAQLLLPPDSVPNGPAVAGASDATPTQQDLLLQPAAVAAVGDAPAGQSEQLPPGKSGVLTLEELEQMATASNPAIAQARVRVTALEGASCRWGWRLIRPSDIWPVRLATPAEPDNKAGMLARKLLPAASSV